MIIPAILEQTAEGFQQKFEQIKQLPGIKTIQVDFADGKFVENTTLAVGDLGKLDPKYAWEAHLMVEGPRNFNDYVNAGFKTIIVHYEAYHSEMALEEAITEIIGVGAQPALALSPQTPVSVIRYLADTIKQFTVLSVEPGKQGNSFIEESFARVQELRSMASDATIEVDGGVNAANAKQLIEAGATNVAVGSALFETEAVAENYQKIVAAIK